MPNWGSSFAGISSAKVLTLPPFSFFLKTREDAAFLAGAGSPALFSPPGSPSGSFSSEFGFLGFFAIIQTGQRTSIPRRKTFDELLAFSLRPGYLTVLEGGIEEE